MKIELTFAELHNPLFLGNKNHQMKLTASERTGLKLVYDQVQQELWVYWEGHEAIVPLSNVSCMWPKKLTDYSVATSGGMSVTPDQDQMRKQEFINTRGSAQVSSPTDHVFAGPGKGKSR